MLAALPCSGQGPLLTVAMGSCPWPPVGRSRGKRQFVRMLADFKDPHQEWRRLFSELFGTFLLVLVAAGGGIMGAAFPNTVSRTAAVTTPALMVLGVILFMGKVSGAHLNPAVSIAFALRGDFPWRRVPGYIVVQLIGASLAALWCGCRSGGSGASPPACRTGVSVIHRM